MSKDFVKIPKSQPTIFCQQTNLGIPNLGINPLIWLHCPTKKLIKTKVYSVLEVLFYDDDFTMISFLNLSTFFYVFLFSLFGLTYLSIFFFRGIILNFLLYHFVLLYYYFWVKYL